MKKLIFAICSVLPLSSWWQQPLGKTYCLRCRFGVMVSNSFAFEGTKNCRQHTALVFDVGNFSVFVTKWRGTNCE